MWSRARRHDRKQAPTANHQQPKEPAQRRRSRRGFTLLEVLVALAILSVVLMALQQSFSSNIFITSFTRGLWKAMVFARNETARWERQPPEGSGDGEFREDHPLAGYRWRRRIELETPFPGIRVRRIELELTWNEGGSPRRYQTEIYVLPK